MATAAEVSYYNSLMATAAEVSYYNSELLYMFCFSTSKAASNTYAALKVITSYGLHSSLSRHAGSISSPRRGSEDLYRIVDEMATCSIFQGASPKRFPSLSMCAEQLTVLLSLLYGAMFPYLKRHPGDAARLSSEDVERMYHMYTRRDGLASVAEAADRQQFVPRDQDEVRMMFLSMRATRDAARRGEHIAGWRLDAGRGAILREYIAPFRHC